MGQGSDSSDGEAIAPGADASGGDADADIVAGEEPASARVPLDRASIVAAAVDLVDEVGPGSLTMRSLGTKLGVEAMSLYRYVPGKEDLLDAIVEHLISSLYADPEVHDQPRDGWQDFLQRLAHGVRRMALAHVQAFPLVASRPPEAPWLRPPLRSVDWVESFLTALLVEGFDDTTAVAAYRAFTSFLLGNLLLEVASRGADVGPLDVVEDTDDDPSLEPYPTVARLRSQLSEDAAAEEFEMALEQLLDRLTMLRAGRAM